MSSNRPELAVIVLSLVSLSVMVFHGSGPCATVPQPVTVHVFYDNGIHYSPEDPRAYETTAVAAEDNGRVLSRTVSLPSFSYPTKIVGCVSIKPVPQDDRYVCDPIDRAGNIRIVVPDKPDLEVVKFVTAYGGETEHVVDLSYLAPFLRGERTFKAFIDTWVSPAWRVDFSLAYLPAEENKSADWVAPVLYEDWLTEEDSRGGPITARVSVPRGLKKVVLHYYATGHCTNGIGSEEFESKDNIVTVDGAEVYRCRPWRNDCSRFRAVNPYCTHWSNGMWSSDPGRSGWCPGDVVSPHQIDMTEHLSPGGHTLGFEVQGIRPKDAAGHLGYWRLSAHLVGWRD